jgi:hypothetical protein
MTVTIKDLPKNEELDRKAMAAVHGGIIIIGGRTEGGIIIHGLTDRAFQDPNERDPVQAYLNGVTQRA